MKFSVEKYRDNEDIVHDGEPPDLNDTTAVFVHVTDPENDNYHRFFWAFNLLEPFESWDEWFAYIVGYMEMYGLSFSDE